MNQDVLYEATQKFSELLNVEYDLDLAKNKNVTKIKICFDEYDYKHLFGLHKLKDIHMVYAPPSKAVFTQVMNGKITYDDIRKSEYFSKIENRINNLNDLEKYLDKDATVYKWNHWQSSINSKIQADYLIPNEPLHEQKEKVYIFLRGKNENLTESDVAAEHLISFVLDERDYTAGQDRPYTLLYKAKINVKDGTREVQYHRLGYDRDENSQERQRQTISDIVSASKRKNLEQLPEVSRQATTIKR